MRHTRWRASLPLLAACLIHAVLTAVSCRGDDPLMTDSRQYVDVARHVAAGHGIVTGVLPLGYAAGPAADRASPILPVYAHHPPGFPILIALASRAGIAPDRAVLILPIVGSFATLLLLHRLARRIVPPQADLVAFLYALGAPFAENANHALSEPIYLALLVGLFLVGGGAGRAFPGSPRRALLTGVLCGLLFAVRYTAVAALLLLAVQLAAAAFAGRSSERAAARRAIIAWGLGVLAIALPVVALVHRAGALEQLPPPLVGPLGNLVWWTSHVGQDLLLTFPRPAASGLLHAPLGGLLVLAGPIWLLRQRAHRRSPPRTPVDPIVVFCALYPLVHVAWLTVARSLLYINTSATRHLIPAYPFLLIVLARAIAPRAGDSMRRATALAPAFAFLVLYAAGHALTTIDDVRLASTPPDLGHVPAWIRNHTVPGEAIIATEAELLVHVVPDRRFVALVRWPYAGRVIEASDVPKLRDALGARWLIVLTGMGSQALAGAYGGLVKSALESGGGDGLVRAEMITGGVVFAIEGSP